MAGYTTAIALMGLGLGILLPANLDPVLKFLPSSAAAAFTTVTGAGDSVLSPRRRSPGPRRLGTVRECPRWIG
jgi:hypothetical protein